MSTDHQLRRIQMELQRIQEDKENDTDVVAILREEEVSADDPD